MPPTPIRPAATTPDARRWGPRLQQKLIASWLNSRLSRVLIVVGALALVLTVPGWLGAPIGFWAPFCRFIFYVVLAIWLLRLAGGLVARAMWSLRNRLLVAYALMALIPIVLLVAMVGIAAYLFYGQYSAYLLNQDLRAKIEQVADTNSAIAAAVAYRAPSQNGRAAAAIIAHYGRLNFPAGGIESYIYRAGGRASAASAPRLPSWLQPGFSGFVTLHNRYYLAAYAAETKSGRSVRFLSLYAVNTAMLDELAARLGEIRFNVLRGSGSSSSGGGQPLANDTLPVLASTRPLPAAANRFDIKILFWTSVPVTAWNDGRRSMRVVSIATRPAMLNQRLFSTLAPDSGDQTRLPLLMLGFVGVLFLILEFFALVAGARLTRSITRAVHALYVGTQHVHAGDFAHRIAIRSRDQLADLGVSFNEMTDSITALLAEQRQKERLENELFIAQEVQAQLFPHGNPRVTGLEISGRCLPARSVSGDYFDFFDLDGRRMAFALGDVSGKGISAALLMATVASAMRAYQGTAARARAVAVGVAAGLDEREEPESLAAAADMRDPLQPAALMQRLNSQLCRSTTPEKYVTLFYGLFDSRRHELLYCNAGHLPPVLFTREGRRRLETGGMVAGLFEETRFEQGSERLEPGDLLVAWSDGITEPENEYGVEFGEERLFQLIEAHRSRPVEEIRDVVLAAVREWSTEREQADDITLLVARVE